MALTVVLDLLYLSIILVALLPYLFVLIVIRRRPVGSMSERLGAVHLDPKSGYRVWLHAVSVGELEAARPLIAALSRDHPEIDFVVSTTTTTAQALASERYGCGRTFLFPLDLSFAVHQTLQRVDPDLVVLVELEAWPQHLISCQRRGVPVLVVNGRVSRRGYRRARWIRPLYGWLLGKIDRFLVQTEEYGARLQSLGVAAGRIEVAGNLKYEAIGENDLGSFRAMFEADVGWSPGLRWVAGSTHPGEESVVLKTHLRLRQRHPGLTLILAPRHVERAGAVLREVAEAGLNGRLLSGRILGDELGATTDVLVVDQVGHLARLYGAADVAFVGGSLVPTGGHNIVEPIACGTPSLHGPQMANFRQEVELFTRAGGAIEVADAADLERHVDRLLTDPAVRSDLAERAAALLNQHRGAVGRTVEAVLGYR